MRRHTREDSGIRLDRELRWWHDGERVEHPRIVEVFNTGLVVRDDGRYELRVGGDWCLVEVEDAAYAVVAVDENPDGSLSVRLSDRTAERLSPGSVALDSEGVLTCRVKQGRATARFTRDAQFALGNRLEVAPGGWQLSVGGCRWSIR